MRIDLSELNAGQIVALLAVAATCFTAVLAVVGSLIVSVVNSRSARRLARETARREFQINGVKPYLDLLDRRISLYDDLTTVGPELVSALHKLIESLTLRQRIMRETPDASQEPVKLPHELEKAQRVLQEIQLKAEELKTVFRSTGLYAFILSDQRVLYRTHTWLRAETAFLEIVTAAGGITAAPEQLTKLRGRASKAFSRMRKNSESVGRVTHSEE